MTRAAAMIAVMAAGSRETRCRALKCLNMALALSAGARMADSRLLRVSSSGVGQGFFVGVSTPIPAPWYPLSARTGIPNQADRYRAGSTWSLAAVGSWVEPGSTGPVYTGNPAKIHHHLHVAPERLPLARVPQVAARVRVALSHPVGADQGPVQADERLFRSAQPVQDLGKVRGPVGDHPQGLMQIPVGRGPAHLRVAGQGGQGGARHHPPQQEHRLNPAGGRPLPGPHVMGPAVGGQPQADGVGDGLGNIESGRIGQHAGTPW